MLWAGKSNTFVTAYYNSNSLWSSSSDTIYSTEVQPYRTNWRIYQTIIPIGGSILSPVMSSKGENGSRHFCLLGALQGIFGSLVVHVGCTAVASFKQSSGTTVRGVTKISGCLPTLSTCSNLKTTLTLLEFFFLSSWLQCRCGFGSSCSLGVFLAGVVFLVVVVVFLIWQLSSTFFSPRETLP